MNLEVAQPPILQSPLMPIRKFPKILVCSRTQVPNFQSDHDPTHIVSLRDVTGMLAHRAPFFHPNKKPLVFPSFFDDELEDCDIAPKEHHVQAILNFTKQLTGEHTLLVHCYAGISRSTAIALAVYVQHYGNDEETINQCVKMLLEQREQAVPNPLISFYADKILGAEGRLFLASEAIVNRFMFPHLMAMAKGKKVVN